MRCFVQQSIHHDRQSIIKTTKVAALQHYLEKTETSSIFPLKVVAHVIGWNERSSKAEMDRPYYSIAKPYVRKKATGFRVELPIF